VQARARRRIVLRNAALLLALVGAIAGGVATTAHATAPAPLTITLTGTLTGPSTATGTWTATGLFEGSGTYVEEFRFAGPTIHFVKTFTSTRGSFVLVGEAVADFAPDGLVTFRAGSWLIVDASGGYEGLHAHGSPAVTADSFGSLATGEVHVVHDGMGRVE
jgi:hypothetical protein